ncbi:hypothetical protein VTH82DRAFT_6785 [Thermothelomyces myriococcoides]
MAHIHELAPEVSNYSSGRLTSPTPVRFPRTPMFASMNKPCRFEGDVFDLEVSGTIPPDIDGTFFRVQPDHRFPPLFEDDIHFNGDGSVTAIRISGGHADLRQRYVRTERYLLETRAHRSLFGRYRNPWTDNESVRGVIRTASNTNVVFWRGALLAMKEDGPPFAMDPVTLETLGRYDFEGQILSPTFTAHPKFDPDTGEMNWVVLPLTPLKMDLERMKRGGNKFAWDPNEDQWYGVVPRRGAKSDDIIWFRADNGFHGHVAGCYELPSGEIVFDLTVADGNVFFFFPPDDNSTTSPEGMAKRNRLSSPTTRWIFDPKAKKSAIRTAAAGDANIWVADERVKPALTWLTNGEFSRIDDRYVTKPYRHFWQAVVDPTRPYDFQKCGPPAGGLFNCLGHYTWSDKHVHDHPNGTGDDAPSANGRSNGNAGESAASSDDDGDGGDEFGLRDVYFAGPTMTFQEPTFIPREGGAEGEGYLIALLNHLDELRNDVVIFDAQNLAKGPLAVIHLPLKLKLGLHGNWVDSREIEAWQRRRAENGDLGPLQVAKEPLPWQKKFAAAQNGLNSV